MLLPAYTLLLGLIALLGYMGHAADLKLSSNNDVVPALFKSLFPSGFAGFAYAAIAIGALVPAAVMSIGAANQLTSLVVKVGAPLATLYLPTQFALDLQLLGGLWILQTFPAVKFGLFMRWFTAPALLAGWAAGLTSGTLFAIADGLKPLHKLVPGDTQFTLYVGLFALVVNVVVAVVANLAFAHRPTACPHRT